MSVRERDKLGSISKLIGEIVGVDVIEVPVDKYLRHEDNNNIIIGSNDKIFYEIVLEP